jgi:hypothetical protein
METYIEKAENFIRNLPRESLVILFTQYPAGRTALEILALALLEQDERRRRDAAAGHNGSIYFAGEARS